jgi:hypothetical protein
MAQNEEKKEIAVYLLEEEVEMFKVFREHQDIFQFMIDSGVFELKRGAATINFDDKGIISSIKKEVWHYPKNKKNER